MTKGKIMKMKLIEKGIYNFGENPNRTRIAIAFEISGNSVLFYVSDINCKNINSHAICIRDLNKIDSSSVCGLEFEYVSNSYLTEMVHGYLGQVPEELFNKLFYYQLKDD